MTLTVTLVLLIAAAAATCIPVASAVLREILSVEWVCFYAGKSYKLGEEIVTENPCQYCTCHVGWKEPSPYSCALIDCPWSHYNSPSLRDCPLEYTPGECCPRVSCPATPPPSTPRPTTQSPLVNFLLGLGKNVVFTETRTLNATETIGERRSAAEPCAATVCGFPCYPEPPDPDGCSHRCRCPQSVREACEFLNCPSGSTCSAECNVSPQHPYCVPFCASSLKAAHV